MRPRGFERLPGRCRQKGHGDRRLRGQDFHQRRMHRDFENDPSLLLDDSDEAILDMLSAHADHVTAPLSRVEQQPEDKPRAGAYWVPTLELRDFGVGPCAESVGLTRLDEDTGGWVIGSQPSHNRNTDHCAQGIEEMFCRMWMRYFLRNELRNMLSFQSS
jgi:hypothetical protein